MAQTILTEKQKLLLEILSQETYIRRHFYLTGGTALAEYYLKHRLSEDLDFFSPQEAGPNAIQIIFKKIKPKLKFQKVVFENSFNRNLFFIHFPDAVLKIEFTYYPFEQIEQPKEKNGLKIDALTDIAVNKTNTILTNPRTRDFIDLYLIIKKQKWTFKELTGQARNKFDIHVDPLVIAQQLLTVSDVKDHPRMIIPFKYKECETFWLEEAGKLQGDILTDTQFD